MHPTFQHPDHEAAFTRQGYLLLPGLAPHTLQDIRTRLESLRPSDGYGGWQDTALGRQSFHVTFFDSDRAYREAVFGVVRELFAPIAEGLLADHRMVQGNVFLKPPGQGPVHPHQNLTIVDETRYRSVSFWCPLVDTNLENGTLCLVPGSQEGFFRYRNTKIYWPLIPEFRDGPARSYLEPVEVPAGGLLVLDDRIVHATPPNLTDRPRWVLHSLWAPRAAELKYFGLDGSGEVVEYGVPEDFWQYYAPGTDPVGLREVGRHGYDEPTFTSASLLEKLESLRASSSR